MKLGKLLYHYMAHMTSVFCQGDQYRRSRQWKDRRTNKERKAVSTTEGQT